MYLDMRVCVCACVSAGCVTEGGEVGGFGVGWLLLFFVLARSRRPPAKIVGASHATRLRATFRLQRAVDCSNVASRSGRDLRAWLRGLTASRVAQRGMATLCSLFQQPGTALPIGLLEVLDPWIWNLAAVVLELLPSLPISPAAQRFGLYRHTGRTSMHRPHVNRPTRPDP